MPMGDDNLLEIDTLEFPDDIETIDARVSAQTQSEQVVDMLNEENQDLWDHMVKATEKANKA